MQRSHRNAHALIWTAFAVVLPLALAVIFLARAPYAGDAPAILISPPVLTEDTP